MPTEVYVGARAPVAPGQFWFSCPHFVGPADKVSGVKRLWLLLVGGSRTSLPKSGMR